MFCSTPQRLAKIKSYEYEINGKKKLETTTKKNLRGSRESKPEAIE